MRLQKVFGAVLFVVFFLWLHFAVRFWAIGADIPGSVCNDGGPFGLRMPQWLLIGASIIILALLSTHSFRERLVSVPWSWLFIISGGLGNALERLLFGCIMDYIALPHFPAFNVADALLTAGVVGIVWQWRRKKLKT